MRRINFSIVLSITVLMATFVFTSARSVDALPAGQETNLLQNPGFEGRFGAWSGINEIQVAAGWTPWWWEDPDHNPAYFRPEYKRARAADFANRVLSGESAQQWFTFHASHIAGMYQQVFNVIPGQTYRFTIWAQVWSSSEDNPHLSVQPANPHLKIGIDPRGFWNPGSPDIMWSAEGSMSSIIDQWAPLSVEATAQDSILTVFMFTNPDFANKHNDMYWDNASLILVGSPAPTSLPPTNTSGPPTATLRSTEVIQTTESPSPTIPPPTVSPASPFPVSGTPEPAATASPTVTPESSPTQTTTPTAIPTATDKPTATPSPTRITPALSVTPSVLATPTAVTLASSDSESQAETTTPGSNQVSPGDELDPIMIIALIALGILILLLLVAIYMLFRR